MSLSVLFENVSIGILFQQEFNDIFIVYAINNLHPNLDEIAQRVLKCQSSLLMENVQTSKDTLEHGFLIHQWSLEHFRELLLPATSLLLCLIDKNQQKLAGYQMLTSINTVLHYLDPNIGVFELRSEMITHEEWSKFISATDVRYLEQTGVAAEYQRQGIATYLTFVAKKVCLSGLCTFVLDWPYSNLPSYHFKLKNGFRCIGRWQGDTGSKLGQIRSQLFIWHPSYAAS